MKNNFIQESSTALILILLLLIVLNPFHVWMPSMMHMIVISIIVIVFALFASFILKERVVDERDAVHRMLAGRAGFLTGSALLIIGIIVESIQGKIDSWMISALVGMIIAKIVTRIYSDSHN